MTELRHRYDFVFFFDVQNGNPNGDPDAGNLPRIDPETGHGLVSDVAIKRRIRNYIASTRNGEPRQSIYVMESAVLNEQHRKAYAAIRKDDERVQKAKALSPQDEKEASELRAWMSANFFDIRAFGAVMSTGINCGQIRGPLQFTFGRSVEPIAPIEIAFTRVASTNAAEKKKTQGSGPHDDERGENRTMARKQIVPYALYRAHGFVNAKLAQKTGFTVADLNLFKEAVGRMYDLDRSTSKGEMSARRCIAFRHESDLGNAPAHKLLERVQVSRVYRTSIARVGDELSDPWPPARGFTDYQIDLESSELPAGVRIEEWI